MLGARCSRISDVASVVGRSEGSSEGGEGEDAFGGEAGVAIGFSVPR